MSAGQDEDNVKLQQELDDLKAEYSEFAYAITHDLIAPFRQIEGFSNIILSNHGGSFDEKTTRHFGLIIGGAEKGKAILEALLEYSRLITADIEISAVDCSSVIEEINNELSSLIESSCAKISYVDAPVVHGDKSQLYQLFYHIIHNALHYQKANSSPRISIEAKKREQAWEFCIADNGTGIRDSMTDKIFTALRRGVAEKEYAGIGMGLTIARSVVQRHGGQIWVTSEPGSGSSFHFTLNR